MRQPPLADYFGWQFALLLCLPIVALFSSCHFFTQSPDELEPFTGAHTRVVWVQEQGDGRDTFGFGNNLKLMGLDSRDGQGERSLLDETGNFFKPIITPSGKEVVVSSRSRRKIYLVDFDRGTKKDLGPGVAIATWQDPVTKKIWVYALAGNGTESKYLSTNPLIRFLLNKPSERELVWDKTHISWSNFNLSRDGKIAGGLFPWPHAGILNTADDRWEKYGQGCWTALSPDNSAILWIFDGTHKNLHFVNPSIEQRWTTTINNAPGIDGHEVYHPRWSNHVRYLTMTGPYVEGEGGNKIDGGGVEVEIYIGKFNPSLTAVEKWLQVSHNSKADFYPDVWIADGGKSRLRQVTPATSDTNPTTGSSDKWPVAREHAVFLWQDMLAANQLLDDSPIGYAQTEIQPVGQAHYNRHLEMDFNGGSFIAQTDQEAIAQALRQTGSFTLELLYTPTDIDITTSGTIFRYLTTSGANTVLSQDGKNLVIQLPAKDNKSMITVNIPVNFTGNQPMFITMQLTDNRLEIFTNGRSALNKILEIQGPASWKAGAVYFGGSTLSGTKEFMGALSHVCLYTQPLTIEEITLNVQLVTGAVARRQTIPSIQIKGILTEASTIPTPDSLGAYARALVVNRYLVQEVQRGNYPKKEILVAHWAVLDRQILPKAQKRGPENQEILQLERFDLHPELEGERLIMDMFDPDLDLYYSETH